MTKQEKKELNNLRKIGESMNVNKKTIKIWEKNLKQGYRFFQPHNAYKPLPRTLREAYGYNVYQKIKDTEFNTKETTKAYIATLVIALVAIAISFAHADDSHQPVHKRTSQGGRRVKMQTMNKNKKASFKKYRGQGR
jgi:hypothetical protein